MSPSASVIIPAHDESARVRRCVESLLATAGPDEFDVIVVANGCSDDTAETVRGMGRPDVRCLELPEASKSAALNAGDAVADHYPRIYLDADIALSTEAARALCSALGEGDVAAAAPRLRYDLTGVDRPTARYLRVLESLPVFARGYVGSGCYALSRSGRARFGTFPDLIGDDRYVNELFSSEEKVTLTEHRMEVAPPRDLANVVRRSLRVKAGSLQLQSLARNRPGDDRSTSHPPDRLESTPRHLITLVRGGAVLDVALFATVQVVVIIGARWRRHRGRDRIWLRDESSRRALM